MRPRAHCFRLGQESPHDYLAQQKASASGQYPVAIMLSCIDDRRSATLAELEASGALKIAGAMYNIDTGLVFFG